MIELSLRCAGACECIYVYVAFWIIMWLSGVTTGFVSYIVEEV